MKKVVKFNQLGNYDVLEIQMEETRSVGAGEVLLDVHAFGLNRSEVMFTQGYYVQRPEFPSRIGYEASGIVKAVGEGVTHVKVGDKVSTLPVITMTKDGVWAEESVIPANSVIKAPEKLSMIESAGSWIAYTTAWGALIDVGQIKKGDFVMITAAASSVGLAAIQIVNRAGAIPIATVRKADKVDKLKALGAKHVIVTNDEDLEERAREITGDKGIQFIMDPISGPGVEKLANALAYKGALVIYGMLDYNPTPFPMMSALGKSITLRGYTISEILNDWERLEKAHKDLRKGFNDNSLSPKINKTFKFDDIKEAMKYMDDSSKIGKVVIEVK